MKKIFCLAASLVMVGLFGCASKEHVIWTPQPMLESTQATEPIDLELMHDDGLEYAVFPMDELYITQTSGEGTHLYNCAIDLAGKDSDIDDFYAPFTLRIVRIQEGYNIVWAQSVKKVHLANGGLDYVTMLLEHSNDIDGLYVGQVIPQGEVFYSEGTAGNADGNHVHAEFAIGPYVNVGSHHTEDGRVALNNGVAASEILFLTKSTNDQFDGGLKWKSLPISNEEIFANGYHCQGYGHRAELVKQAKAPTCILEGENVFICSLCKQKITEAIPANGHKVKQSGTFAPNGEGISAIRYTCDVCEDSSLTLDFGIEKQTGFVDTNDPFVAYACEQELMVAFEDNRFLPDGYITRLELLTILYDLGGIAGFEPDFSDVYPAEEAAPIIGWAAAKGLADAIEDNRFIPRTAVTRHDAIVMVSEFMPDAPILDTDSSEEWAVASGMFSSEDDLNRPLTRAEAAKLLSLMKILPTFME